MMNATSAAELIDDFEEAVMVYARCSEELVDVGDRIPDRVADKLTSAREALLDALTSDTDRRYDY